MNMFIMNRGGEGMLKRIVQAMFSHYRWYTWYFFIPDLLSIS